MADQFYCPTPLMGQTGVKKMAVFGVFYPISFIVAFIALECVKRYWEMVWVAGWFCLLAPMCGSNWGHEIAFAFIVAFMLSQCVKTYCGTLWTI